MVSLTKTPRTFLVGLALASLTLGAANSFAQSSTPVKINNLDFEADLDGWKNAKSGQGMVTVSEKSGFEGKGVRVADDNATLNARLTSDKAPAKPGKVYEVTFRARNIAGPKGVGGFLVFYNAAGERLEPDHESGHHKDVPADLKEWSQLKLNATAPADAAFVGVEIRSNKASIVTAEFDSFKVYELP